MNVGAYRRAGVWRRCASPIYWVAHLFGEGEPVMSRKENVMQMLKRFWNDERGLELPEYAVMTALIIAAIVGGIGLLATAIVNRFADVEGTINTIS